MLIVLCKTGDRDVKMQSVLYNLPNNIHLTNTSIAYDKVRVTYVLVLWILLFFFLYTTVSSQNNLLHRGIVVRTCDGLYIVLAIVFL